jgi:hypothetical protein
MAKEYDTTSPNMYSRLDDSSTVAKHYSSKTSVISRGLVGILGRLLACGIDSAWEVGIVLTAGKHRS